MVCGLLCVALPTTVLSVEFSNLFEENKLELRRQVERKSLLSAGRQELMLITEMKHLDAVRQDLVNKFPEIKQMIQVTQGQSGQKAADSIGILFKPPDR